MMTIVLLVGWFQFFRRNESGLRFAMRKIWRLRNVRSSTIDPLLQSKLSLHSPLLRTILRFPSIIEGLVQLWNSSQRDISSRVFFLLLYNKDADILSILCAYQLQRRFLTAVHFQNLSAVFLQQTFTFSCSYHPRSSYFRIFKHHSTFISM